MDQANLTLVGGWAALAAIVLPFIIAVIKQRHWGDQTNRDVVFGISLVTGILIYLLTAPQPFDLFSGTDKGGALLLALGVVIGGTKTMYDTLLKGLADKVEEATSATPPVVTQGDATPAEPPVVESTTESDPTPDGAAVDPTPPVVDVTADPDPTPEAPAEDPQEQTPEAPAVAEEADPTPEAPQVTPSLAERVAAYNATAAVALPPADPTHPLTVAATTQFLRSLYRTENPEVPAATEAADPTAPLSPPLYVDVAVTGQGVLLEWAAVAGAESYRIYLNGRHVADALGGDGLVSHAYADTADRKPGWRQYAVTAVAAGRPSSAKAPATPVKVG